MNYRILVTGAATPAGRSMIDVLRDQGATVLACDCRSGASAALPALHWFVVHSSDDPEFVGDVVNLCAQHDVDAVVPARADDQLSLARTQRLFDGLGTRLWLAPIALHATHSQARRILQLVQNAREGSRIVKLLRCLSQLAHQMP